MNVSSYKKEIAILLNSIHAPTSLLHFVRLTVVHAETQINQTVNTHALTDTVLLPVQ